MKIFLGADHGGFELKEQLKPFLVAEGHQVEDCGAFAHNLEDDYPEFAFAVAEKVVAEVDSRGILLCRSGGGMVIAANKVPGCRAVLVYSEEGARHAASHDGAQVISLAGDWIETASIPEIIQAFLTTSMPTESRHRRRIEMITQYEKNSSK